MAPSAPRLAAHQSLHHGLRGLGQTLAVSVHALHDCHSSGECHDDTRGVVGLFQPGIPGEVSPSLSVRMMGINQTGAASYLLSLYCSVAMLTHDAVGVLEGVTIDNYYEYA